MGIHPYLFVALGLAVVLAFALLGESFTLQQWLGAGLFAASVLLVRRDTGLQIADEETWWQSLFPEEGLNAVQRTSDE